MIATSTWAEPPADVGHAAGVKLKARSRGGGKAKAKASKVPSHYVISISATRSAARHLVLLGGVG